jgi:hypothetical protein
MISGMAIEEAKARARSVRTKAMRALFFAPKQAFHGDWTTGGQWRTQSCRSTLISISDGRLGMKVVWIILRSDPNPNFEDIEKNF